MASDLNAYQAMVCATLLLENDHFDDQQKDDHLTPEFLSQYFTNKN